MLMRTRQMDKTKLEPTIFNTPKQLVQTTASLRNHRRGFFCGLFVLLETAEEWVGERPRMDRNSVRAKRVARRLINKHTFHTNDE